MKKSTIIQRMNKISKNICNLEKFVIKSKYKQKTYKLKERPLNARTL